MENNKRFIFLDYLRVFAFTSVLVGHKFQNTVIAVQNNLDVHVVIRGIFAIASVFTEYGGAGVVVFFLVSGYVITYAIQKESAEVFLGKRFFRIYPLFVFAVISEILFKYLFFGEYEINFLHLLGTLTLTGDLFGIQYALAGVEWTLRLEMMFYVIFYFAKRFELLKRKKLMAVGMIFLALIFISIAIPSWDGWSKGYTSLYLPFIFMGVFFRFYDEKSIGIFELVGGVFILYLIYLVSLPAINPILKHSYFTFVALLLFVIFWIFGNWLPHSATISKLSVLTYAVYLFHNWIWGYFYIATSIIASVAWVRSLLVLILLLFFCKLCEKFIETPAQKFGKKMVNKFLKTH